MKVILVEGCTVSGCRFDDVFEQDLTPPQRTAAIEAVLAALRAELEQGHLGLSDVVQMLTPVHEECADEPCDSCGDYVSSATYYLPDTVDKGAARGD